MLPQGWAEASLGDCSEVIQYGLTCTSSANGDGYRYIRITDLQDHKVDWAGVPFADADRKKCAAYEVRQNDLLFARTGATVGKSHLITHLPFPSVFASYLIRVACNHDVLNAGFAGKFFQSPNYWRQIYEGAEGTGQPNFNGTKLAKLQLVLPPVPEQRRIVEKLDALTARLARARAELDRVPVLVARYKKDLLAEAFDGGMTREWRKKHGVSTPWAKVAWREAGTTLNGRAYPSSDYAQEGIKLLRPGNLSSTGRVTWTPSNTRYLPRDWAERHPQHHIRGKALLINLTAQSLEDEFLGRACLSSQEDEFLLNQRVALFVPNCMIKEYCLFALQSPGFRAFVDNGLNSGSLIQHIHTKQLEKFVFHVAPKQEQTEIVSQLSAAFARADRLEAEAARSRVLLDRLESALLAKAFRGELVPQDPKDEPASVLLERIRAHRAIAPAPRRARGRGAATV